VTSWPDEDAAHLAVGIADRLVDEIEKAFARDAAHGLIEQHPASRPDIGLSGLQDVIHQIDKALGHHFRQRIADREPDDIPAADQLLIGFVGEHEHMGRAGQDRHEAWRLLEQVSQEDRFSGEPLVGLHHRHALGRKRALDIHLVRRLDDDREHAAGLARVIEDRRIVEIKPEFVRRIVVAEQDEGLFLQRQRLALHIAGSENLPVQVGRFRPSFQHLHAHELRVALSGKGGIGVVVDQHAFRPEQHHDGDRRLQADVHRRADPLRPVADRADAGLRPVEGADQLPAFAAADREFVIAGARSRVGLVCHEILRLP